MTLTGGAGETGFTGGGGDGKGETSGKERTRIVGGGVDESPTERTLTIPGVGASLGDA